MVMMNQTLYGSVPVSIMGYISQQDPIFTLGDETTSFFIATTTQDSDAITTTIMTGAMAVEDIITAEEGAAIIETEPTEVTEDAIIERAEEATEDAVAAVDVEAAAVVAVVVADNS